MRRYFFLSNFLIVLLLSMNAQAKRIEREVQAFASTGIFLGVFDAYDVFFAIPASSIKHAGVAAHLGLEYTLRNGFGIRPQFSYEQVFYTSIGIQQAAKNQFVTDLLFSKYLQSDPQKRCQPFVAFGPSIAFSSSGKQAYLKANAGSVVSFSQKWGLRTELSITTEFSGARGELSGGINYRF